MPEARRLTPNLTAPTWGSGSYAYDGAGNISQIGPSSNENKSSVFSYDLASRLKSAAIDRIEGKRTESYDFDEFGNITRRWINGKLYDFGSVNAGTNRLQSPYTYDAVGNLTSNGAFETYDYDALNMMTAKHPGGGWDETYIYTPSDERIGAKISTESWSWTIRDFDAKVLREFKTDPNVTTWTWAEDYVWQDGHLVAGERPVVSGAVYGGRRHFHVDHLGSPRLITNQIAQVISYHDYAPYGEELSSILQEPSEDRMNFTGHERDFARGVSGENTGYIDYMHARYYQSMIGRFFSVDPVIDRKTVMSYPQAWNGYAYVRNNPSRWADPTGKVISYDDAFLARLKSDKLFKKAFQAWKQTKQGAEQVEKMKADQNTTYVFKVGVVKAMVGVLKEEEANGVTLPMARPEDEKKGKLDLPFITMTINAEFITKSYRLGPERTPTAMARALFEEASHGLDTGSASKSYKEAWAAEEAFHSDTEPRMKVFEGELKALLPPGN